MDLRSIMNTEAGGPQQPQPSLSPRRPSEYSQEHVHGGGGEAGIGGYHQEQTSPDHSRGRPPQPPPLQPAHYPPQGEHMSHGYAQSPYQQHSSASTASSGGPQAQRGHTYPHALQTTPSYAHEYSSSPATAAVDNQPVYNQSPASAHPHFGPHSMSAGATQSYSSRPRSHHSSIHSATTPSSSRSYSQPHPPPHPPPPQLEHRDSVSSAPQAGPPQVRSYSPSYHRSQPGTPQERPSSSYPHLSPQSARPPSSGPDVQGSTQGSPWTGQDTRRRDQGAVMSPAADPSLSRHNSRASTYFQGGRPSEQHQNRETTMSVSPKTAVVGLAPQDNDTNRRGEPMPTNAAVGEVNWQQANNNAPTTTTTTTTVNAPSHSHDMAFHSQHPQAFQLPSTPKSSLLPATSRRNSTSSPLSKQPSVKGPSPAPMSSVSTGGAAGNVPANLQPESTPGRPKKRRKRYNEPPIFAQKAPRTSGKPPPIPGRPTVSHSQPSLPAKPPPPSRKPDRVDSQAQPKSRPHTPSQTGPVKTETNGQRVNGTGAGAMPNQKESSLGPWEPSITGVIPHEELTKIVCDFLFEHVVMRRDIGAGPPGAAAAGAGAMLEIEAKLGQVVDKNRGDRLRIPVLTESVLSKEDPSMRTAFESTMSQAQHRALNNFLNDSVKATMNPAANRIPISYAHKKERDSFYEIAPAALPPIVQQHLNPRHKPKVRVTVDQRSGAVLARIIKCRIADLDVYSPRTCLDWRLSVNLEMNYDGDVSELVPATGDGKRGGDRNKDRMSYRHLAYQIDLTQVAGSETPQGDFEHELEVEISSAEVRRQGDLALAGDMSNQYEELVKGFVDNVRVLARAVPSQ